MAFYFSKTAEWGIRSDLTCTIFKPTYEYLLTHINDVFETFFMSKLKNPGDKYYFTLPSDKIAYFDIYAEKVQPLLKKNNVSITNTEFDLVFTKGDDNVKHSSDT